MPRSTRTKFPLLPQVFRDDTDTVAEGNIVDSNGVRFNRGKWESRGGYASASPETFEGIVRGGHAWADNSGTRIVGFGTANKLYALYGGEILDITPLKGKGTLVNPFYTKDTSDIVLVIHAAHGLYEDDTVTYANADAGGGITLNGDYTVTIRDLNSYWVAHSAPATSNAGPVGGKVEWEAELEAGRVDGIGGLGYGTGFYGTGLYGVPTLGDINPTEWRIYNWGQNMMALRCGGALYEWQPRTSYEELYAAGAFTTAEGGTLGAGWAEASDVLTATAGSASDATMVAEGILQGGVSYEITLAVTRSAGGFQFRVTSEASGSPVDITLGETIEKSFTYTRRFTAPAVPTTIKIAKDSSFAGTVEITSLKIISTAYRLHDAPQYSLDMMVDPQNRVILGGTVELDGTYNAMHLRWCDVGNNRTWTPSDENGSGFETLRDGSAIRGMIALKAENLVWTDVGLSYMRRNSSGYDIKPISGSAGIIGRRARTEMDGVVFWMSANNFHIYQGGRPQTIDCSILRDVFDNIATNQEAKITATINPAFSEVEFEYPDLRFDAEGECSRKAVYNWAQQNWYTDLADRSEWIKPGVHRYPIGFGLDGQIYFHEYGETANGNALSWYLETGALDLGEGDNLFNLMSIIPDFEAQLGTVTIEVSLRNSLQGDWVSAGEYLSPLGSAEIWMRHQARQMKLRFSQSSAPARARFGDIKAEISPSGARR